MPDTTTTALPSPITGAPHLPPFPETAWRGVFADWRSAVNGKSECPLPFHYANLLSLISSEIGDRIRNSDGAFLNFFVFACGRTGTKKSTATDYVHDHLTKRLIEPHHVSLTSISSAEGLIRTLIQHPNVTLRYDEIKDLFVTGGRNGSRLEPILNAGFDLRRLDAVVKKKRESLTATDYYLSLMLNGTPDHVRLDLSEQFFAGGLLNRFFVFGAEPSGLSIAVKQDPDAVIAADVAQHLGVLLSKWRLISPGRGGIKIGMTDVAEKLHKEWYDSLTLRMQQMSDFEAKPLTRLDTYAKKVAAMYCLLESPPSLAPLTTESQMSAALDVVDYCRASMSWMTFGWSGPKSMAQQSEELIERRIEAYLHQHGCVDEPDLYRALHIASANCAKAVAGLCSFGIVDLTGQRPRRIHTKTCQCGTDGPAK